MASTSRSQAQARTRGEAPPRPTSSVFPEHTPASVNNAISYPNFVRSTLPSTEPAPDPSAPLLLVPSKPTQEEEPGLREEDDVEQPSQTDDDTADGELFQAALAARARVRPVDADPRAAILRFVEKKEREEKLGHRKVPIVRGVVARPARKKRKVDVKNERSGVTEKQREVKDVEPIEINNVVSDQRSRERERKVSDSREEGDADTGSGITKHATLGDVAEPEVAKNGRQADTLFAYSSSEEEGEEDVS